MRDVYGNPGEAAAVRVVCRNDLGEPIEFAALTVNSGGSAATIYADSALSTVAANPVTANGSGVATFYAPPGVYTFTVAGSPAVPEPVTVHGGAQPVAYAPNTNIAAGESSVLRCPMLGASISLTSGALKLTYAQAQRSGPITKLQGYVGATPGVVGGATITAQLGIYSVDGAGNLTLLASTASDTNMFTQSSGSLCTETLTTTWNRVAGQWYAYAALWVATGGTPTAPTVIGATVANGGTMLAAAPRLSGTMTGQTGLPASIPAASVGNNSQFLYLEAIP